MSTRLTLSRNPAINQISRFTTQRSLVVDRVTRNYPQWSKPVSFTPATRQLGENTSVVVDFTNTDPYGRTMRSQYVRVGVKNKDDSSTATLFRAGIDLIKSIKLYPNGLSPIEIKDRDTFREIFSDYMNTRGKLMQYDTAFWRQESTTTAGISIAPGATAIVWYPLDAIIDFSKLTIYNSGIGANVAIMKVEIEFIGEANTATDACKIIKSSADENLLLQSKIEFTNIDYIYSYFINGSKEEVVPLFDVGANKLISVNVYKTIVKKLYSGQWSKAAGSYVEFKLDEISKTGFVQYLSLYARVIPTAYNSTESCKEYSGYRHIGYVLTEGSGNQLVYDMSDPAMLKEHEYRKYMELYGEDAHLPLTLMDSDSDFAKYFLRQTVIDFDTYRVDKNHEVVRYINTSNGADNFKVKAVALSELGSTVELYSVLVTLDENILKRDTATLVQRTL
jgi:hypothetical protein